MKWPDSKVLLVVLFHDLLKPSSVLCKVLQENDICVVQAIEAVGKAKKSLDNQNSGFGRPSKCQKGYLTDQAGSGCVSPTRS